MSRTLRNAALAGLAALALGGPTGGSLAKPVGYDLPEETTQLRPPKDGTQAGHAAAQAQCLSCHSPDYIAMQPPGKGAAFWQAEVGKMIKVYGAPIREDDAKTIAAYLAATY